MCKLRLAAIPFAIAVLLAGAWLWMQLQPGYGYVLVEAYCLVAGSSRIVLGTDGPTLAAIILCRPLMWLFLGYSVAAVVGCRAFELLVSCLVLIGLAISCAFAPHTIGLFLLGLDDVTMLGGIAFILPGTLCVIVRGIVARVPVAS